MTLPLETGPFEAGIFSLPSAVSVGDSYDNALAETINRLGKAEVIHRCGPWRNFEPAEFATLEWADWFYNRRLPEPIGHIQPNEAENVTMPSWTNQPWPHNRPVDSSPLPIQLIRGLF